MEERKASQFVDDTGKYQELNSDFVAAIIEVCLALQEAGFETYDQLTGFLRTGNDRYITRYRNARTIVTEMDTEMIRQYLHTVGHMPVVRK